MLHCADGLSTAFKVRPWRSPSLCLHVLRGRRCYSSDPAAAQDVAVLGGGITGLACAYYLTKELPRLKITIYEASDRLGGWLSSKRVPVHDGTILFEAGPRGLRPASNGALSARLLQELDLAKDTIFTQKTSPAATNRYVYYPDHLVRMPHPSFGLVDNIYSLLTEPIFSTAVWSGITEMSRNPRDSTVQDESVGSFFSRRMSKTVVDRILSAVLHGIYAGDAWKLSAKSLFPRPWRDEGIFDSVLHGAIRSRLEGLEVTKRDAEFLREMFKFQWDPLLQATLRDTVTFTFKDGLSMLTDRMIRYLMSIGNVDFKTSAPVQSIAPAEDQTRVEVRTSDNQPPVTFQTCISALSPARLNEVHQKSGDSLVPVIPSVTVMTVNLYYRTPNLSPAGFGYLIPLATPFENNPERALGVVFDTAYSPSPKDLNMQNWAINDPDQLKEMRAQGRLINVNDFAWYNMPDRLNIQDEVTTRGSKVTVMLGGHYWDEWPAYPDEKEGLALAKSLLERHLGIKEEPEAYQVNLQKDCIPQYTVGHEQRLQTAHNNLLREYRGRLRVTGSWTSGVGVNDCLRSAWEVVRGLKDGRDRTGLEHVGMEEYVRLKPTTAGQEPKFPQ